MAGNYPDVPAPRMAYDRDGSVAVRVMESTGDVFAVSTTEMQEANNESTNAWDVYSKASSGASELVSGVLIFPQLRDISGVWWGINQGGVSSLDFRTSVDTTNGFDGTWVSQGAPASTSISASNARQSISAYTLTGIKAIKLYGSYRGSGGGSSLALGLHVYGAISTGETPDRLRIWHPTLDEPLDDNDTADGAYFDWGDIQRNTTSDKTFRIKNNSATLTANGVIISQQSLTETTPLVAPQFTFSDGGAFAASVDIGNLAPGAISPVITKRYTRPSNAILSIWTSRTIVNPTSWS